MPDCLTVYPSAKPKSSGRDARLDFWRGLCLVDMVLVHLIGYDVEFGHFLRNFLTDYTRFAAGGFVFLSGLCMGMIFLPKVIAAGDQFKDASPIYRRIWIRSLKILLVQFVTELLLMALDIDGSRAELTHHEHFVSNLLHFHKGYANDLLMLYVGMLAVTPLLLELLRHGWWAIIGACSALLFAVGSQNPWRLAFVPGGEFPIVLWQAVFIGGLLFTMPLKAFDVARRRTRVAVLVLLSVLFAVIFQSANATELGIKNPLLHLEFAKIPLTFGELLRYIVTTLLIMLGTNAIWGHIKLSRPAAFLCLLGRNSLFVYIAHLFVQSAVAALAYRTTEIGMWQISYGVLMIAVLGILAYWVEQFARSRKKAPRARIAVPPPEESHTLNEGSALALP